MAYLIPAVVGVVLRFIVGLIPLSIMALTIALSGCGTAQVADRADHYSIPPQQTQPLLDYRDFGVPSQWDRVGVLAGQSKVRAQLMADMRLLMQLGVSSRIYKVQNRYQAVEYWLIAADFDNRHQARSVIAVLEKSGMWFQPVSLLAMPGGASEEQVAGRTR